MFLDNTTPTSSSKADEGAECYSKALNLHRSGLPITARKCAKCAVDLGYEDAFMLLVKYVKSDTSITKKQARNLVSDYCGRYKRLLKTKSEAGNVESMYQLARLLMFQNKDSEAIVCLTKAKDQGHIKAGNDLSQIRQILSNPDLIVGAAHQRNILAMVTHSSNLLKSGRKEESSTLNNRIIDSLINWGVD